MYSHKMEVMMFLLIDNYDSFTYNLVQIFQKLQVNLHVLRNDDKKNFFSYLKTPGLKGIVLSPGPGSPASSGLCREVLDRLDKSIPVLECVLDIRYLDILLDTVYPGQKK